MDKKRSLRKVGSIYLSDKTVSTRKLQMQKSEPASGVPGHVI